MERTMSKEEWFRHYERLEAEHPDATDEELSDLAFESMTDQLSATADALKDAAKYEGDER
jgi:hypothetical protein